MTVAPDEAWRRALDEALAAGQDIPASALGVLANAPPDALETALREAADASPASALPVLVMLGDSSHGGVRRIAKRALYRLAQRGIAAPPRAPARPVVERGEERPVRAWVSAIDGSGSRAMWILFEAAFGALELCSVIVNDVAGILEVAGGGITRSRLNAELTALRAAQKLPWLETEPARALGLVAEALALHRALGTSPPAAFARWQRRFDVDVPAPPILPADADPVLVARGGELLDPPEMTGWFLEPTTVQADPDESEEARISRVVGHELDDAARARWARRLLEMVTVFEGTGRAELGAIARAAASALVAPGADSAAQPFARALARRALEVAGEVASGRLPASAATRTPATRA